MMKAIATNPFLESIRAAYRRSHAYRVAHGEEPAVPQREAGEDDESINAAPQEIPAQASSYVRGTPSKAPAGAAPDSDTLIAWSDRMISDAEADRMEP